MCSKSQTNQYSSQIVCTCFLACFLALGSLRCIPPRFVTPNNTLKLQIGDKKSEEPNISFFDGKLLIRVRADTAMFLRRDDEFGLDLTIRIRTHNMENIVVQPDSITVLYHGQEMSLALVSATKPSDTLSFNDYRVILSFVHKRKPWVEFRGSEYDYESPLKIILNRLIMISGNYLSIDTVLIANE